MSCPTIRKQPASLPVEPNLVDYDAERARFCWADARADLDGLPDGAGLNIGHEAVDRHVATPRGDHPAIRWLGADGSVRELTFGQLREETNRFANLLDRLEIRAGERVATLLGHSPALTIAALGTWKHRAVLSPLSVACEPGSVRRRLTFGDARVVVTTRQQYERTIVGHREQLPGLHHVLIVDGRDDVPAGTIDLDTWMAAASPHRVVQPTDAEYPAFVHVVEDRHGRLKGVVHVHEAIVSQVATARFALDLHRDDVLWCSAEPGSVTHLAYGVIAPLALGAISVVDEAPDEGAGWCSRMAEQGVSVWFTTPEAIRAVLASGDPPCGDRDLSALRFVASGERPLAAGDLERWDRAFGWPIHEMWSQPQTGAIVLANLAASDVRPGSVGRPLPGFEVAIVRRVGTAEHRGVQEIADRDTEGELAVRAGWPSMFRLYLNAASDTRRSTVDGWYLTGVQARRDRDGYLWLSDPDPAPDPDRNPNRPAERRQAAAARGD